MGQKINPNGFRVGVIRNWTAKWYADKNFADYLNEDLRIRKYIEKHLLMPLYQPLKLNVPLTASTFQFTCQARNGYW